jgi:hypothetical protein
VEVEVVEAGRDVLVHALHDLADDVGPARNRLRHLLFADAFDRGLEVAERREVLRELTVVRRALPRRLREQTVPRRRTV